MKKQPEITEATKNRITDAFFKLYETKPINKIRIIDITTAAKCNRSTFYEYFSDIYKVLEYGEQRIVQSICTTSSKEYSMEGKELLQEIANIYIENGKYLCILLGENGDPKFLTQLKSVLYDKFLEKQQLEDNYQTELVYEYSLTGLIMAFRWWYLHQDICSIEEYIKVMKGIIQKGALSVLQE